MYMLWVFSKNVTGLFQMIIDDEDESEEDEGTTAALEDSEEKTVEGALPKCDTGKKGIWFQTLGFWDLHGSIKNKEKSKTGKQEESLWCVNI